MSSEQPTLPPVVFIHILETTPEGQEGDYLAADDNVPVSPVFDLLTDLYMWMYANGWDFNPRTNVPWEVIKGEVQNMEWPAASEAETKTEEPEVKESTSTLEF